MAGVVLMGLLASFLSGTRGAWLAIPVLLFLFLFCRHLLRLRTVLIGTATISALFALLVSLPQTQVLQRIKVMILQTETYLIIKQSDERSINNHRCLDDKNVLQSWISLGHGSFPTGSSVEVMDISLADKSLLASYGCTHGYALYLSNHSNVVAWLMLPRYQPSNMKQAHFQLISKGVGQVGSEDRNQYPIHTQTFTSISEIISSQSGDGIMLTVSPSQVLWVIPEESYDGEYSYPILDTPVGQRFDMWHAAIHLFMQARVFGVGLGAYQAKTKELVKTGAAVPVSANFDHPHSDYFDALATRGMIGFFALLLILAVPAWLYSNKINSRDPHQMGAALGGLLVAVGFAIFGLTETMFIHSVTIGWYVIMTSVFLVSTEVPAGQGPGKR